MRGLLLAALVSSAVQVGAHPVAESKHSLSRRTVDLDAFRLVSTTEYVNATEVEEKPGLRFSKRASYVDTATEFVKRTVPGATFRVINDHYVGDNGIAHVYLRQTAHDLDIDNADFNVNVCTTRISLDIIILKAHRSAKMDKFFHTEIHSLPDQYRS